MHKKRKDPFSPSFQHVLFASIFSVASHLLLIFLGTHLKIVPTSAPSAAEKKLPKPQVYEPLPAAKQRALFESLNHFLPYIGASGQRESTATTHPSKEPTSSLEESSLVPPTCTSTGPSLGDDKITAIHQSAQGVDFPTVTSSDTESIESDSSTLSYEGALHIDSADLIASLENEEQCKEELPSQVSQIEIDATCPPLTSSVQSFSYQPDSEPFELRVQPPLFEKEGLALAHPNLIPNLFHPKEQKQGQTGLQLPNHSNERSAQYLLAIAEALATTQVDANAIIESKELSPFGEIMSDRFRCTSASFQVNEQLGEKEPLFLFRFEIEPTSLKNLKPIDTEILFLIDRSHSIDPVVFNHFKAAVSNALSLLPKECRFNIAFFDKQTTLLQPCSPKAIRSEIIRAKTFLIGQDHGGLFASTDLFKALASLKPSGSSLTSAIALTDGETFLTSSEERGELLQFISNKNRDLSLFAATTGESNNLKLLGDMTALCRGSLAYEKKHQDLHPLFLNLIRSLSFPIAKDLNLSVAKEEGRTLSFLQPHHRLPALYAHRPYVIYGATNRPGPLTIFIQGQGRAGPITIKKEIVIEKRSSDARAILEEIEAIDAVNRLERTLMKR